MTKDCTWNPDTRGRGDQATVVHLFSLAPAGRGDIIASSKYMPSGCVVSESDMLWPK
jgi:hypothetical protein